MLQACDKGYYIFNWEPGVSQCHFKACETNDTLMYGVGNHFTVYVREKLHWN